MPKLGVNIDHVATLRQARRESDPDPVKAARLCEEAGADSIVCHLREDRRHINDRDVKKLKRIVTTRLNLEMSLDAKIVRIAERIRPQQATLVPEKRQEVTTEGGLDVDKNFSRVKRAVARLKKSGITVSLFVDPVKKQITRSLEAGADAIEIHTGRYDHARTPKMRAREFNKIKKMVAYGNSLGLTVHAGHGLKYTNTKRVAKIKGIDELNIGHSIVSRAVFVGLKKAVKEMKELCG